MGNLHFYTSFGNLAKAKCQVAMACELAKGNDCLQHNPNLSFIEHRNLRC